MTSTPLASADSLLRISGSDRKDPQWHVCVRAEGLIKSRTPPPLLRWHFATSHSSRPRYSIPPPPPRVTWHRRDCIYQDLFNKSNFSAPVECEIDAPRRGETARWLSHRWLQSFVRGVAVVELIGRSLTTTQMTCLATSFKPWVAQEFPASISCRDKVRTCQNSTQEAKNRARSSTFAPTIEATDIH